MECKYWLNGFCKGDDGSCRLSTEKEERVQSPANTRR
jgi:hypothetical protein